MYLIICIDIHRLYDIGIIETEILDIKFINQDRYKYITLAGFIGVFYCCFLGTLFAAIRDIRLLVGVPRSCLELPHSYSACVRYGCAGV